MSTTAIVIGWVVILLLTGLMYYLICRLIKEFAVKVSNEIKEVKANFHNEIVKAVKEAMDEKK